MTNVSTVETIGLDLSDRTGLYVVVGESGGIVKEGKVSLTRNGIVKVFGARTPTRIALEVGTHSPWVSRALDGLGYEVIVANARQVRLISHSQRKNDRADAQTLARLARFDPALLKPIHHRGEQAQADLALLRSRKALVEARTSLINSARGMVSTSGGRLPSCSADSFVPKVRAYVPACLQAALTPLLASIEKLTQEVAGCTGRLKKLAAERYPETGALRQVKGVGPLVSLAFVLTLEDPQRFRRSRDIGAYLGLVGRQRESGESKPQLGIPSSGSGRRTKAGDVPLRSLLVQSAHYILGPFGPDCDLRRWGLKLAGSGNKTLKKKAITAVARKLSVLLHRLWLTGEVYDPLRQARLVTEEAA